MKKYAPSLLIIITLLFSLFPALRAGAQSPGIFLHLDQVDASAYPNVSLSLNAWDASGLPLANLTPADFQLQEDSSAAFPPLSVEPDLQAPLGVVLVLDISSSMAGKPLTDAKVAAARFLDRLKPGDQAALVAFSDNVNTDPSVLTPARELAFTTNLAPIYDLVDKLTAQGSTQLYNASSKAVRMASSLPAGHRAVLLLTDGRNDPANVGSPDEAIALAKTSNVPFFVIGLGDQIDETYLRRLANETGGLYRAAPSSSELARLFADTATLLKTQYNLSFTSALKPDGARHTLVLTLKKAGAQAETRMQFGPLPAAPTATTVASALPPTAIPTSLPPTNTPQPPAPTVVPTPTPQPFFSIERDWPWALAAFFVLLLILALVFLPRGKKHPAPLPEVCAQCGTDVTGKSGACPNCGSTRRLPKRK